jgi:lipid II:glycine glycyltransferase (peptidoglycan interpeptide bridge formation enzyme)
LFTFKITPVAVPEKSLNQSERFLQTPFWADFKSHHGWKELFFNAEADMTESSVGTKAGSTTTSGSASSENALLSENKYVHTSFFVSILVRSFGKGPVRFSLAYIPMQLTVPGIRNAVPSSKAESGNDEGKNNIETNFACIQNNTLFDKIDVFTALHTEFASAIKQYLPVNTLCVRYDPPYDFSECEDRDFFVNSVKSYVFAERKNLAKTDVDIQPPDTVLLDITKSEEDMLAAMRNKWRYNVHYAEKHGVTVKAYHAGDDGFDKALDTFYALDEATSRRDGNAIHAKSYYKDLIELSAKEKVTDAPLVTLYMASNEGDDIAAIITLFSKREAVYLFGASGNVKRNLMPAYLLQWTAIRDAKAYGSPVYDFYGMPPTADEHHPMYGLYLFKTGFGGQIVHRAGSFDVPVSGMYKLYTKAEKIRAFYHKKIVKKLRGR